MLATKGTDDALALALVGVAVFSIAELWQRTAPSLADIRSAPGDLPTKQKLVDADVVVGLVAICAGIGVAILSRDATAMIMILVTFGALSLYYHAVLAAPTV